MQKNIEITTGQAVNVAYMNYVESDAFNEIIHDNQRWQEFNNKYGIQYEHLRELLGENFQMVDNLLNNIRIMHDIESEICYRIGIRDGVNILGGRFINEDVGGR